MSVAGKAILLVLTFFFSGHEPSVLLAQKICGKSSDPFNIHPTSIIPYHKVALVLVGSVGEKEVDFHLTGKALMG